MGWWPFGGRSTSTNVQQVLADDGNLPSTSKTRPGLLEPVSEDAVEAELKSIDISINTSKYDRFVPAPTGWERLVAMYSYTEFGFSSFELDAIVKAACTCAFVGMFIVGVRSEFQSLPRFVRASSLKVYQSTADCRKRIRDQIWFEFFKNGLIGAFRYFCVSWLFITPTLSLAAYKNQLQFRDFLVGGACMGLYRWTLGIKAVMTTALIGFLFSYILAAALYVFLRLEGYETFDQPYKEAQQTYFQQQLAKMRMYNRSYIGQEEYHKMAFWKSSLAKYMDERKAADTQRRLILEQAAERERHELNEQRRQQLEKEEAEKKRQAEEQRKKSWWRFGF